MVIRKASQGDVEKLTKLRVAYLLEDYGQLSEEVIDTLFLRLPGYFKDHLQRDFMAYVAEEKGEMVATAGVLIVEKPMNPSFLGGRIGSVMNVYTKPECRRRGIAKRLLEMLLEEAKKQGLDLLELKATADGKALYKALGFDEKYSKYTSMELRIG